MRVLATAVLALALWAVPVRPGVVIGDSMAPSFHSGQVFLMSRLPWGRQIAPGDVVVFSLNGETFIKRVLALPGETVWVIEWAQRDGTPAHVLSPSRAPAMQGFLQRHPSIGRLVQVRVPPGSVYVVGDAAGKSVDSRHFGPVPIAAIRGRLMGPQRTRSAPAKDGLPTRPRRLQGAEKEGLLPPEHAPRPWRAIGAQQPIC